MKLSEENGKLVGHKNHKQRIEYLVKLKKDNTKLQEVTNLTCTCFCFTPNNFNVSYFFCLKENEKLRTEVTLMRENLGYPPPETT